MTFLKSAEIFSSFKNVQLSKKHLRLAAAVVILLYVSFLLFKITAEYSERNNISGKSDSKAKHACRQDGSISNNNIAASLLLSSECQNFIERPRGTLIKLDKRKSELDSSAFGRFWRYLKRLHKFSDDRFAICKKEQKFDLSLQFAKNDIDPKKISPAEVDRALYCFTYSVDYQCEKLYRIGTCLDGGYEICQDCPFQFQPSNCLVYSFGSGGDFRFDDEIVEKFACRVVLFDPSMNLRSFVRKKLITFYPLGLSNLTHITMESGTTQATDLKYLAPGNRNETSTWNMMTFEDILKSLGHLESVIDYLKVDIEHYEWRSFQQILRTNKNLLKQHVKQIALEIHYRLHFRLTRQRTLLDYNMQALQYVNVLADMHLLGFHNYFSEVNALGGQRPRRKLFVKEPFFNKPREWHELMNGTSFYMHFVNSNWDLSSCRMTGCV